MPKRYTSRELIQLAESFGWILVSIKGDHHNFKHSDSRYVVTIAHPQKDVPVGRAYDTVKKIKLEEVMRYLIVLEQTEAGIAVQVPDLAITTHGENVEAARRAACAAIQANLEAYREAGLAVPEKQPVETHLENPELSDLLFAYVNVPETWKKLAA